MLRTDMIERSGLTEKDGVQFAIQALFSDIKKIWNDVITNLVNLTDCSLLPSEVLVCTSPSVARNLPLIQQSAKV